MRREPTTPGGELVEGAAARQVEGASMQGPPATSYAEAASGATGAAAGISIPKNARGEVVIVRMTRYRGHELLDARVHYPDADTGELRPTRKGLCLSPEVAAEVARAMFQALGESFGAEEGVQ